MIRPLLLAAAALTLAAPAPALAQPRPPLDQRTEADYAAAPYVKLTNPAWSRQAVLYQLNTRQFTKEGTFRAAQKQLPRLKAMGVDVIWLMPIHPIGEKNRKGTLGSPYAVKDYLGVNPEFGSEADLKAFVDAAHAQGMKVILDWVANHSAWDNPLVAQHPDWYERDWKGDYHPTPWWDWSDIIDFDYSKPALRKYMTEALVKWVRDVGVDGYRFDVAGYVPVDFWEGVRTDLEAIKPVFLLGEWQERDLHARALDATYAWDWYNAAHNVGQGKADATAFYGYYSANESAWPSEAMRLLFTENHDKNAWEATQYEAFGKLLPAMLALEFTSEGIPLVHNGQEACNAKRLEFFERDPIVWKDCDLTTLIPELIAFRKANPALDNGRWGARMVKVENDRPKEVLSFVRQQGGNRVFVAINVAGAPVEVTFPTTLQAGDWREFRGGKVTLAAGAKLTLPAHGYRLFTIRGR